MGPPSIQLRIEQREFRNVDPLALSKGHGNSVNQERVMKKRCFIWILSMLMISVSVLGQDVRYNFDKDTNFSKFKTYEWVALKDAKPVDDLTDKQIKEALDAQLATKGLSKVAGDNAD